MKYNIDLSILRIFSSDLIEKLYTFARFFLNIETEGPGRYSKIK
jgi:hypothetical protein